MATAPWKQRSMARDSSAPRSTCLRGRVVDDVAVEHLVQQIGVIDVGDQMHLRADVLIFFLDTEFQLLALHQALGESPASNDLIVIAPFKDVRARQTFEPRFFASAVNPGVKSGARAGSMSDSLLVPRSSSVTCALPMRGSKISSSFSCSQIARFNVKRRLGCHGGPAVAPVVAEKTHVQVTKRKPRRGERHFQHTLNLRRVVPLVDHQV